MVDIGESLVGSYMRHVRRCHTVAYNSYLTTSQGEIDVIGVTGHGVEKQVWIAEVALHLDGLLYGSANADTVKKVGAKVAAARAHVADVFPGVEPTVELWAPNVPAPLLPALNGVGTTIIANEDFTKCVNELVEVAKHTTKLYGDDAFRMLQLLTRLRGDSRPRFGAP
jgi:hypothetical protein